MERSIGEPGSRREKCRFDSGLFHHFRKKVMHMDQHRPGYYAIIPADVRYDDRIPANAKLLYGEISALIGAEGYCFASNQYFAQIYGMSGDSITRLFKALEDNGYIKREIEKDKSGQVVRRKIYLSVSVPQIQPPDIFTGTPLQNNREGTCKKDGDTITSITVLKENKKEKRRQPKPEPLTDEQLHNAVVTAITEMAQPSWSKDQKNEIYQLTMALYDPKRVVKKAHPIRSQLSVAGTFRKLAQVGSPQAMIDMLNSAIIGGWQGVQVPKQQSHQKPPAEERQYQCV